MAQRHIDFGAFPDDPTADQIRTAFQKSEDNFTELFAAIRTSGVLSINRTPGAGINVNAPVGNVVVTANIACVKVRTNTLAMSINDGTLNDNIIITDSASQTLYIDIPNDFGLTNLADISLAEPSDGQALVYDYANSYWTNGTVTGGSTVSSLDDLTDVDTSSTPPTDGQTLVYDLGNLMWVPGTIASSGGCLLNVKTITTDYTIDATDADNTLIRVDNTVATTVTIPNDTTYDFPIGTNVLISWNGTGAVSIVAEAGVTIDTPETLNIKKRYGKVTVIKTEANHWELEGNLESA